MHIDAHCHIYPDEYFEILEKEGPRYGVKLMTNAQGERVVDIKGMMHPPIELFTNVELRLQTMAEMRLDMNILSFSSNPGVYWADDALGEELCQTANDAYAGIIEKHPTKFHGLASLPAQNIPLSVKELERSVNKLGLKGGFLSTNVNGRYLDDESFYPLYEAAAGMNVPIIVHPANPAGKDQMNEYHLFNLVGFPTESANCIGRLIFSGLFDRLPGPHLHLLTRRGNGSLPHRTFRPRLEGAARVRKNIALTTRIPPLEFLSGHARVPSARRPLPRGHDGQRAGRAGHGPAL